MDFEEKLKELINRGHRLFDGLKIISDVPILISQNYLGCQQWLNDVEIFKDNYLKGYSLTKRMESAIFYQQGQDYLSILSMLESILCDTNFVNKMNGITQTTVANYQAKSLPQYDVFISHANADKLEFVDELNKSLVKLGVNIFYDKDSLEWGDDWKKKIIEGTKKAEFAIIVISSNFFDREWTEKELSEFLTRQNRNGQKIILPILHNITQVQLTDKYPKIADIQYIKSSEHSCDEIALMFAKQLIKRLKQ